MKLPRHQQGGMSRLATIDPGKASAIGTDAISAGLAIIEGTAGMIGEYQKREDKAKVEGFQLGTKETRAQWVKEHGSRIEYDVTELTPETLEAAGIQETEGTVAAYKVHPTMLRQTLDDYTSTNVENISDREMKAGATAWAKNYEVERYTEQIGKSVTAQPIYQTTKAIEKINDKLANRDFQGALDVVDSAPFPDKAKEKQRDGIRGAWQTHDLNQTVLFGDMVEQQNALDRMEEKDSATISHLSEPQYVSITNSLKGSITKKKNATAKAGEADLALQRDSLRKYNSMLWDGLQPDPAQSVSSYNAVNSSGKGTDKVLARESQAAVKFSNNMVKIHQLPITSQQLLRSQKQEELKTAGPIRAYILQKEIDAIDKGAEQRKTDAMKWGREHDVTPFEPIDYENIGASMFQRDGYAETMKDTYHAFTGYLEQNEVAEFSDFMKDKNPTEMGELYGQIYEGLGGDLNKATVFWEQFKAEGLGGTAAVAGQIHSEGNHVVPEKILRGNKFRQDTPELISNDSMQDIEDWLVKRMGNAFRYNNVERALIKDAILDVTAFNAQDTGNWSGTIKSDDFDRSLKEVTGNTLEFNDSYLQAPRRGVTEKLFEERMEDMHVSNYATTTDPEAVQTGVNDGSIRLVGVGKGRYQLLVGEGPTASIVRNKDASAFVLEWKDDYISKEAVELAEKSAKDAANIQTGKSTRRLPESGWEQEENMLINMLRGE